MQELWWTSWEAVVRPVVLGALGYLGLLIVLRAAGKRATAKMNMFDWVVTVALGSMLGTFVLGDNVSLTAAMAGFVTLVGLQYMLSWLSVRSERFRSVLTSEPALLYFRGEFLENRMRAERISEGEILSKVRSAGFASMAEIVAVVLEPDAELSIVRRGADADGRTTLTGLHVPE